MNSKIRVGILLGGKSAEHEVSLQSAKNVMEAIDKEKYEVVPIGIDKDGKWHLNNASLPLLHADNPSLIKLNAEAAEEVALVPADQPGQLVNFTKGQPVGTLDVVFPVLHGPLGEDGTVQGLLKLAGIPFVGADVLGSAIGMDKDVMKRLLREAGIPVAKFLVYREAEKDTIRFATIQAELGLPFFVKAGNLGSSVSVHKVHDESEFLPAINDALRYDTKILIEQYIEGREMECSVLGNEEPIASVVGEIIPHHEFYDYEAKYIDPDGAELKIPADIPAELASKIQTLATETFKVLECKGLARVDAFLARDEKIYINEINTIPGFTKISMYPKLWEASGIFYSELIDRLIQLALERAEQEKQLKTSRA